VPAEPIGDDNPIEAILLTAFPNPERIGCPTPEMIKAMANQQIGRDDPAWNHIWNCSPCFKDFKVIRDARVARLERESARKRTKRNLFKGAAAVAILSFIAYFAAVEFRDRSSHQVTRVEIDLTTGGPMGGSDTPVARLPRHLDEVHLTLPPASTAGRYIVAILESQAESSAIALGFATAESKNGQLTVTVALDLSNVRPGQYFLGTRREVNRRQETPSYYPVIISN
jgi:hypothetical protein